MPVVTINDYTYRSPRHPFSRQCPNFRTCWPGLAATYNPIVSPRSLMLRRVAFLLIQFLQLAHILFFTYQWSRDFWAIPATLLNVLFFFFVAWNLHLICNMEGERMVFGLRFGRKTFDAFLWSLAGAYALMLSWECWGAAAGGYSVSTLWIVLDLTIFGAAWISTWEPEGLSLA